MQFSKLFFSLCCMVALGASLVACSEDEELFDDSGSTSGIYFERRNSRG